MLTPGIMPRAAARELPDVLIEAAELFLDRKKCASVVDGGGDFQAVADDSRVGQEPPNLFAAVTRDLLRVEPVKHLAEMLALSQNGVPAQAGLRAFQDEEFEEPPIVV